MNLFSLQKFYRRHKDNVVMGGLLKVGKYFYRLPVVQKKLHQRALMGRATYILDKIFGNIPISFYLKEFKSKNILDNKFSLGHADDFDVLMLYLLARIKRPQNVVETGVASGRSSSATLEALKINGEGNLFSIDLPKFYEGKSEIYFTEEGRPEHTGFVPKGKEPGWLVSLDLRKQWSLILGDSKIELPKLVSELKKIDIFYHDSDHSYEAMVREFETVWPYLPLGGILLSDDVRGNNAFNDFVEKVKPRFQDTYEGLGIILK